MPKASVPSVTATRKRVARVPAEKRRHASAKRGRGGRSPSLGDSASWRHSATTFSSTDTTAAPCTTWISRRCR